jgi:hypothetical protein
MLAAAHGLRLMGVSARGVEASDKTCRFCELIVPHPCTSNRGAQDCHEQPGDGVAPSERMSNGE